jgi:hypothetical protein
MGGLDSGGFIAGLVAKLLEHHISSSAHRLGEQDQAYNRPIDGL